VAPAAQRVARVQERLVAWYAEHARDLPWRRTRDPYAILVAEVMLQQTQVDRVIPKWHAWLERFPTLGDLASAPRSEAIRAWQGLGYNLRAVRLHEIACQVVAEHGGTLPRTVAGLQGLKGIGRYTAAAVACFAYEQPVAMVDTNVRRVLSRVFEVEPAAIEALAPLVVPSASAYPWNQALMDLGATLCRSISPLCLVCPLLTECPGPRRVEATRARRPAGAGAAFQGSRRYVRGRIVEELRFAEPSLETLIARLDAPRDRVLQMVDQLAADGLLTLDAGGRVRLPD
jgi:A/G-specific adenine glycosylase